MNKLSIMKRLSDMLEQQSVQSQELLIDIYTDKRMSVSDTIEVVSDLTTHVKNLERKRELLSYKIEELTDKED